LIPKTLKHLEITSCSFVDARGLQSRVERNLLRLADVIPWTPVDQRTLKSIDIVCKDEHEKKKTPASVLKWLGLKVSARVLAPVLQDRIRERRWL